MKDKDRQRKCHRLGETKELWQLNAMLVSAMDPRAEKDISGTIGRLLKKGLWLINRIVSILTFWFQ